jgi:hypothetical protein
MLAKYCEKASGTAKPELDQRNALIIIGLMRFGFGDYPE